ncbi:uncharacterized protein GLRG_09531 [Colletotrichum graminicola M1.001]|uniref:Zn(II)2Cys6 transcription factor n=1 Tax=Colletotrichum graminicola (strain M1.001 / M2 / FGSC 10212) TaxID=645133 RepID=E3QU49_COLGM|nr:uncharacterized protein GLRG_09531 [Colletotrichum graminicola M1.001]EFQ34387.1 hypothetical protein GLRG_09531 [Colletotrichum graminicola M1.001]
MAVRSKIMSGNMQCSYPTPRKANVVAPNTTATASPAPSSESRKPSITPPTRAGSPPDDASSDSSTESASSPPSMILESLSPYGSTLGRLDTVERRSLSRLLHKSNFMEYFISPTFVDNMQLDMTVHLFTMFDQGKDAYIAMYSAFAASMGLETGEYDPEANLHRGAMAVEQLRSCRLPTLKREELLPWAGLGLGIVYFSNMALGTSAAPVRRYVLSHIRHLLGTAQISSTRTHYILVFLTAVDINECLMLRELPVCGITPPEDGHVDAYLGVCMPLLQHLYDLCHISYHLRYEVEVEEQTQALAKLGEKIEAWQPIIPPDFTKRFTTSEVIHMLAQSRIYKTAAMLFIHRLRNKFGENDEMASAMSKSIISDLTMTLTVSKESQRCVSFPYMLAAVEARDAAERETALEAMSSVMDSFNARYKNNMTTFLKALWEMKDANPGMSWLDMMPHLPPISVGV